MISLWGTIYHFIQRNTRIASSPSVASDSGDWIGLVEISVIGGTRPACAARSVKSRLCAAVTDATSDTITQAV